MQFYSVQARRSIEVADDKVEITTMQNGRKAARATIEEDGKTLKLFKFLPNDATAATAAEAPKAAAAKDKAAKPKPAKASAKK